MELLFWTAAVLFGLNYFVYPGAVVLVAKLRQDPHEGLEVPESYLPTVSLIVAAYNEQDVIAAKIENSIDLDYPRDRFEIIVVSDGSDDGTQAIALAFAEQGVVALHDARRGGKSAAINRAAARARGDILLLSDANNDYGADAVRFMVRHFFDPVVGAVTGAKHVYADRERESSRGDSAYWRYESAIKHAESRLGSITGGDGEIFAVRKSLFEPIDPGLINDDAAITFSLVKRGYRVLYEPAARSFEKASRDLRDDYQVKARMAAGGFQILAREWRFLLPPRHRFALCFLLHKALRWFAPIFLLAMLMASLVLAAEALYLMLFLLQIAFYAVSGLGWILRKRVELPLPVYLPMYFTAMNLAMLTGFVRYLSGGQRVQWKKAER